MANFVTKAKNTIRKITAITTGAALLTTSLAGAAFAADLSEYPSPFVQDGVWTGLIVIGSGGAAADVVGATNIATTLTEVITTGGVTPTVAITGEATRIQSGGEYLNFNEFFDDVVSSIDDTDLPTVLEDGEYDDSEGNTDNEETFTQELSWPDDANPQLVFGADDDGDEVAGDYVRIANGDFFYNYTFEFDTEIDYDNTSTTTAAEDLEDTTLDIMGKPFIISDVKLTAGLTIDEIELLTGDTIVVLTKGQEFTFNGYTIKVTSVTDPDSTTIECGVSVDGVVKFIEENQDEEFDSLRVGVADVFAIHGATEEDACELTLGSEQILLDDGDEIEIGGQDIGDRDGDPDVTTLAVINSVGAGEWIGFEVSVESDDEIYLGSATDGDEWEDPVFGALKLTYAGLSGETETVSLEVSSETGDFTFENNDGKEVVVDIFADEDTSFNTFFGTRDDEVMLIEDAAITMGGALPGVFQDINGDAKLFKAQNAYLINDTEKTNLDDLEGTKLFVVSSGQTARIVEIKDISTSDGDVSFDDITYGVSYDNRGTVDLNDASADCTTPFEYRLGTIGTIDLIWCNTTATTDTVGPAVIASDINLANVADTDIDLDGTADEDSYAAETEGESLIELSETDEVGNVTIVIKENSDVTDTNRTVITMTAYYNDGESQILIKRPTFSFATSPSFYDASDVNDNDRYAMTEAGSLTHIKEDDDGNLDTANIDLVIGEARYGEAFVSAVDAIIMGGAGAVSQQPVVSEISSVPVVKLDTEVGAAKTAQPVILVGGPAINRLTAEALGLDFPTYGSQLPASVGLTEGTGILHLVENAFGGQHVALIVAGWEAQNTRDAANVLKDYTAYRTQLVGSAVRVTSSAGVLTVGPVVVTAAEPEE